MGMRYRMIAPSADLADLVDCYWLMDDRSTRVVEHRIVPDGRPELIWHFGDAFDIRLGDHWQRQSRSLAAGQITRHFHLRNTGRTAILGIKLQPHGLHRLCGESMHALTDRVLPITDVLSGPLAELDEPMRRARTVKRRLALVEEALRGQRPPPLKEDPLSAAVALILADSGAMSITRIATQVGRSERTLERLFRSGVGLAPKLFSRIIRFAAIFRAVQRGPASLGDLGLQAGYYDQAHFVHNFRTFTGECPSRYGFAAADMANFFLHRDRTAGTSDKRPATRA